MDSQTGAGPQQQSGTNQPRRLDRLERLASAAPETPPEDEPEYTCTVEPPPTKVKGQVPRPPPSPVIPAQPEPSSPPPPKPPPASANDDQPQYTCSTESPPPNVKG